MLEAPDLESPRVVSSYPAYDLNFARVEFARGLDYYCVRTRAMGFVGHARVLDAACGVGQWSLALSRYNEEVIGVDFNHNRLRLARHALATNPGVRNVRIARADCHQLPFPAQSFDAVFCYGVLMFLNERRALAEFSRVLRPNGSLYICANAFGWSLFFMWNRALRPRDPIAIYYGIKGIVDTLVYKRLLRRNPVTNTFLTRGEIVGLMREAGIRTVYVGGEGTYRSNPDETFTPAYRSSYLGFDCVLEWVGQKGMASPS
jgi:SAM-dependent methyltransferase